MDNKLSVLTPVYNGASMIERCYWALLNQTWNNWEWIVVDDGSTDQTLAILQRLAASDARIQIIPTMPNRGRGYARTVALNAMSCDWGVLWDADDLYMPNRLERIALARSQGYEYYTSPVVVMDQEYNVIGLRERGFALKPYMQPIITHAATAARSDVMREIGYNPNLKTVGQIGEDAAMVFRLSVCHRGFYDSLPTMINQVGYEVFLRKSVHSNEIQLRVIQEMWHAGQLPINKTMCRELLRRRKLRLMMLRSLGVLPPIYPAIMRRRRKGTTVQGVQLDPAAQLFVDEVRRLYMSNSNQ